MAHQKKSEGKLEYVDENGKSIIAKPKDGKRARYNPYYHSKVLEYGYQGLQPRQIAEKLDVELCVVRAWLINHPDLREAYKAAKLQHYEEKILELAEKEELKSKEPERLRFDLYKHIVEMSGGVKKGAPDATQQAPNIQIVFKTGIDRKRPIQQVPSDNVEILSESEDEA